MQKQIEKRGIASPIVNCQLSIVNSRRAFTLVELLVVIVILGMLAALIAGATGGARKSAQNAKIRMELAQIDMALAEYKNAHGEYPPELFSYSVTSPGLDDSALIRHVKKRWPRFVLPNVNTTQQAACIRNAIQLAYSRTISNVNLIDTNANLASLVVWLGGIPNSDGKFSGFDSDPTAPFGKIYNGATLVQINNGYDSANTPPLFALSGGQTVNIDSFDEKTPISLAINQNVKIIEYTVSSGTGRFPCIVNKLNSGTYVPYIYFRGRKGGGQDAYLFNDSGTLKARYQTFSVYQESGWNELGTAMVYAQGGAPFDTLPTNPQHKPVIWFEPEKYQLIHPGLDGNFGSLGDEGDAALRPSTYYFHSDTFKSINANANKNWIGQKDFDNITNFTEPTIESLMD